MKKILKNKKGFTLIELLAVIVVLAIIMVIATQQVNSTIKKSRANSFVSSYKMIVKEIKSRMAMEALESGNTIVCNDNDSDNTKTCSYLYDISKDDYNMTVTKNTEDDGSFTLTLIGKGKFINMELGDTSDVKCPIDKACSTDSSTKQTTIKVKIDSDGKVTKA